MPDVIIVGGGPAGMVTALAAAQSGLDTVVYEQRSGAIDKACGEGLMPGALKALQQLGVDPPGRDLAGITYRDAERSADARFADGPGRGVRRTVLHEHLRAAVDAAGVSILEQPVDEVLLEPDRVRVGLQSARYLVAADGLHSKLRRQFGLDAPTTKKPRWGLRQHFALSPWTDRVEVTWAGDSEAYVTPVADDVVGVAILSNRRAGFDQHLQGFPELADRLADAPVASAVKGAGPLRQPVRGRVAGRVLLVGDAAGYVDALTGEGLAVSFAAATALIDCVTRDRPADYERAYRRLSRRSRWLTSGLLWARERPVLAPRIVPAAHAAPWLFRRAVDQLAR